MTHDLKIWPQYFCRVDDGSKTFEVRENDRGFQSGDIVVLREWNPNTRRDSDQLGDYDVTIGYTGQKLIFKVGYVYPIDDCRVVFSLLPLSEPVEVDE